MIETVLYTVTGHDVYMGPFEYKAGPYDREHHTRWLVEGPKLLADGRIRPLKPTVMGGMDQMQEGFTPMAMGQTAGQRLVYVSPPHRRRMYTRWNADTDYFCLADTTCR